MTWRAHLRRLWAAWTSNYACAMCLSPERPWRLMMWYPLGSGGAFVCSDRCWDRLAGRASHRQKEPS